MGMCDSLLQAFSHVSKLLSQCQFKSLEGLVAKDVSMEIEYGNVVIRPAHAFTQKVT